MSNQLNDLSETIIKYEREKNMTDAQLAFESHLAVERIHNLKAGSSSVSEDEQKIILEYIRLHP
ncbi:LBP_cg2779 family protein [Companilactobacillus metriopterae]|uniref:LBP_cg2779 family protein n=1 Tax=Companilactobacillus metriopterae TaxID=1909267 RepID=UPI00100BB5D4|nr:LBP_cg2779 family protein [Companilactobacillus metriopterae]